MAAGFLAAAAFLQQHAVFAGAFFAGAFFATGFLAGAFFAATFLVAIFLILFLVRVVGTSAMDATSATSA